MEYWGESNRVWMATTFQDITLYALNKEIMMLDKKCICKSKEVVFPIFDNKGNQVRQACSACIESVIELLISEGFKEEDLIYKGL